MSKEISQGDFYNIADNNILDYDSEHIPCGRIDDSELNVDVYVFASEWYYVALENPKDFRLKKCLRWLWKFTIYNS